MNIIRLIIKYPLFYVGAVLIVKGAADFLFNSRNVNYLLYMLLAGGFLLLLNYAIRKRV